MSSIFYKEPNDVKKITIVTYKKFQTATYCITHLLYSKEATSKYRNIDLIYINFG